MGASGSKRIYTQLFGDDPLHVMGSFSQAKASRKAAAGAGLSRANDDDDD